MNKAFEKILELIKNNTIQNKDSILFFNECGVKFISAGKAKEIVQEVAKEYNGGWIPCNERLPEDDSICIITVKYPNNETVVDYGWFDRIGVCWYVGTQAFRTSNIIAWQPLPEPYKEREPDNKK
ncbi:MAG: DUF551 domain-containing protein [Lachnospiraceae bacterium]